MNYLIAEAASRAGSQTGWFCAHRADLVLEDFLAASSLECFSLKIQVLILGRNAGIADEHAQPFSKLVQKRCDREYTIEKGFREAKILIRPGWSPRSPTFSETTVYKKAAKGCRDEE